jgi:hypothetical protein
MKQRKQRSFAQQEFLLEILTIVSSLAYQNLFVVAGTKNILTLTVARRPDPNSH